MFAGIGSALRGMLSQVQAPAEQEDEVEQESDDEEDAGLPKDAEEEELTIDWDAVYKSREWTVAEVEENDRSTIEGIRMFFRNEFSEAENAFAANKTSDPIAALAYASCGFQRAMMSLAANDLAVALRRCRHGENLGKAVVPKSSVVYRLVVRSKSTANVPNYELRAGVTRAECALLSALLLLLQESMISYIKAGLALRRAFRWYQWCAKVAGLDSIEGSKSSDEGSSPNLKSSPDGSPLQYDRNTISGIKFGLGAMNVVNSALPPKILSVFQWFGVPCDRELGLSLASQCHQEDGLRSPLAGLFLLMIHGLLPSFAPVLIPESLPIAKRVLQSEMSKFPGGAIHMWINGRVQRLERNSQGSLDSFDAVRTSPATTVFRQLRDIAEYEMAWCDAFSCRWTEAAARFAYLGEHNSWSKAFYAYARGACLDMAGNKVAALEAYKQVPELVKRKFGGKTLSVEQLALRRVKALLASLGQPTEGIIENEPDSPLTVGDDEDEEEESSSSISVASPSVLPASTTTPSGKADKKEKEKEKEKEKGKQKKPTKKPSKKKVAAGCVPAPRQGGAIHDDGLLVPGLELVFLFNGFCQMSTEHLTEYLTVVRAAAVACKTTRAEALSSEAATKEELAMCALFEAALLKQLGEERAVAEALFASIDDNSSGSSTEEGDLSEFISTEKYVLPYGMYENACMIALNSPAERVALERAVALLDAAKKFQNFSFELHLHLRAHLAQAHVKRMLKGMKSTD